MVSCFVGVGVIVGISVEIGIFVWVGVSVGIFLVEVGEKSCSGVCMCV